MAGIIPAIRVDDMAKALDFYTGTLGFRLRRGGPEEEHCGLERGDASLMLEKPASFYSAQYNAAIRDRLGRPGPLALYIEAPELEALYERAMAANARIVDPLAKREWGQSEFTLEDPWGNWLTFWRALPRVD